MGRLNFQLLATVLIAISFASALKAETCRAETTSQTSELRLAAPDPSMPKADKQGDDFRLDNSEHHYQVNSDYTYTAIIDEQITLLTSQGLESGQRSTMDYYPDSQSLELIEAYVIQPNGEKIKATAENIFTRPSQESQDAPGFTNSLTTTIVFPKLRVGSQTVVKWKLTQKKPSIVGFSDVFTPLFQEPTIKQTVEISLPASLKLQWKKRGDYQVTDKIQGDRRMITATIANPV